MDDQYTFQNSNYFVLRGIRTSLGVFSYVTVDFFDFLSFEFDARSKPTSTHCKTLSNSGVLRRAYCHDRPILVFHVTDIGCRALVRYRTPLPSLYI